MLSFAFAAGCHIELMLASAPVPLLGEAHNLSSWCSYQVAYRWPTLGINAVYISYVYMASIVDLVFGWQATSLLPELRLGPLILLPLFAVGPATSLLLISAVRPAISAGDEGYLHHIVRF